MYEQGKSSIYHMQNLGLEIPDEFKISAGYALSKRFNDLLENEAIAAMLGDNIMFADTSSVSTVKVSIGQFYGIEINDFAVTVAKTALWIAEAQMLSETEKIINRSLDFLPLKSYANIVEGNALRIDWESVVSKDKLSYINIEYVYCQEVTIKIEYY